MKPNDINPSQGSPKKNDATEPTVTSISENHHSDKTELPFNEESTTTEPKVTSKTPDIFDDLDALSCSPEDIVPSEKLLTFLPVRKPKKDEWVRSHSEISTPISIYEKKDTGDSYLVLPSVVEALNDVVRLVRLTLTVNYAGVPFLWPVPIPTEKNSHSAHIASSAAAEHAKKQWIRISWNGTQYDVHKRTTPGTPPLWPAEITSASDMLRFASKVGAFEVIDSLDHPVVKHHLGLD